MNHAHNAVIFPTLVPYQHWLKKAMSEISKIHLVISTKLYTKLYIRKFGTKMSIPIVSVKYRQTLTVIKWQVHLVFMNQFCTSASQFLPSLLASLSLICSHKYIVDNLARKSCYKTKTTYYYNSDYYYYY